MKPWAGLDMAACTIGRVPLMPSVVGSCPPPDWLIDRERLFSKGPPRVRAPDIWRFDGDPLEAA